MSRFIAILCTLLIAASPRLMSAPTDSPVPNIAGAWRLEDNANVDLGGWSSLALTITVDGDRITIIRRYVAGKRTFEEKLHLDTSKGETIVPMEYWPDHRSIAANIGGDKTKRVRATWIDGHRILRLNSDLVLDTQQGSRAVNILSDYKISSDGRTLTLVELRSSRSRPVICIFKRA